MPPLDGGSLPYQFFGRNLIRGPQGFGGDRGIQGERGLQGPSGPPGLQGPPGEFGGPQGERGERGYQGDRGPQGIEGPVGQMGPQGERGLQGPIGLTGPQGERGHQGHKGTAASDLFYLFDNSGTPSPVSGQLTSDAGGLIDWPTWIAISTVPQDGGNVSDLFSNVTVGSFVYLKSANDATKYLIFKISSITINPGVATFTGIATGSSYISGASPLFDDNEPTMISFIVAGPRGQSGWSGISGRSGYSGYSGHSGYSGYSGSGISGYSGYSGLGLSGYSGYSGQIGGSGLSGYSGHSGISGFSGYSGSGISGYSGYSGLGLSGYSGYSGQVGSDGASGHSGYSGFSGSGVSGYSGYSGVGISGYSGYSGELPSFTGSFEISDWGTPSGGFRYITLTHNLGTRNLVVEIWNTEDALNPEIVSIDQITLPSVDTINLRIPSDPDMRFDGKVVINGGGGQTGGGGGDGASGYSGYSGYSGFSGLSGYSGAGLSGYSGYSGTGSSGISGYSGYSGVGGPGESGLSGYSGYSGAGSSGYSGYSGLGSSGTSGYSGYSGVGGSGASGASGYSGYSGAGTSGYSGYSGAGTSGASGYSGYSGVGFSGSSGLSGYSGFSGAPATIHGIPFDYQALHASHVTNIPSGRYALIGPSVNNITGLQFSTTDALGGDSSSFLDVFGSNTNNVRGYLNAGSVNGEVRVYAIKSSPANAGSTPGNSRWVEAELVSGPMTVGRTSFAMSVSGAPGISGYSGFSGFSGQGVSGYSGYSGSGPEPFSAVVGDNGIEPGMFVHVDAGGIAWRTDANIIYRFATHLAKSVSGGMVTCVSADSKQRIKLENLSPYDFSNIVYLSDQTPGHGTVDPPDDAASTKVWQQVGVMMGPRDNITGEADCMLSIKEAVIV